MDLKLWSNLAIEDDLYKSNRLCSKADIFIFLIDKYIFLLLKLFSRSLEMQNSRSMNNKYSSNKSWRDFFNHFLHFYFFCVYVFTFFKGFLRFCIIGLLRFYSILLLCTNSWCPSVF